MAGLDAPVLGGFSHETTCQEPVELLQAFMDLSKRESTLKVTFGSVVRYGTIIRIDTSAKGEDQIDWRIVFRWCEGEPRPLWGYVSPHRSRSSS